MGLWEGVKAFTSKAVSIVGNAVKTVGRVFVETAKAFLTIEQEKLALIVQVVEAIARGLGIIKEEENVEELGDKAMKADKKPEDFDSINEYIEYLRNEIRSSGEELARMPPEQRLARRAVGSAVLARAIEEEKKMEIPVEFWKESIRAGLGAKETDMFLTKFRSAGIKPRDFARYLRRELNISEEEKIDSVLVRTYKELEPELDENEIEKRILRLQDNEQR